MIELEIDGMTCEHCVRSVTEALRQVPGVEKVQVSLKPGRAIVEGKPETAALKSAVREEGYSVTQVS
jgi:copper chaperone